MLAIVEQSLNVIDNPRLRSNASIYFSHLSWLIKYTKEYKYTSCVEQQKL